MGRKIQHNNIVTDELLAKYFADGEIKQVEQKSLSDL